MCTRCLLLFLHVKANGHFKPSTTLQGQCLCSLPKWPVPITGCGAFSCTAALRCLQLCSMATCGIHPYSPVTPSVWQLVTKGTRAVPTAGTSCMASGVRGAELTDTSPGEPGTHSPTVQTTGTSHLGWESTGPGFYRKGFGPHFARTQHVAHTWNFTFICMFGYLCCCFRRDNCLLFLS